MQGVLRFGVAGDELRLGEAHPPGVGVPAGVPRVVGSVNGGVHARPRTDTASRGSVGRSVGRSGGRSVYRADRSSSCRCRRGGPQRST